MLGWADEADGCALRVHGVMACESRYPSRLCCIPQTGAKRTGAHLISRSAFHRGPAFLNFVMLRLLIETGQQNSRRGGDDRDLPVRAGELLHRVPGSEPHDGQELDFLSQRPPSELDGLETGNVPRQDPWKDRLSKKLLVLVGIVEGRPAAPNPGNHVTPAPVKKLGTWSCRSPRVTQVLVGSCGIGRGRLRAATA